MRDCGLSRRSFLRWSGTAAAASILAACQPKVVEKKVEVPVEVTKVVVEQVTPTPAPPEAVDLVIWYGAGGAMLDAAKKAAQAWTDANPLMPAELVSTPIGAMQTIEKLMSAIAGGTAPDLAHVDNFTTISWAARLAFEDLQPYVERDGVNLREEFFDWAIDESTYKGHLYSLTILEGHQFFAWNKKHFAEVGLDPESPPKSAEELEQYADLLDKRQGGKLVRIGFDPYSTMMFWALGFWWYGCAPEAPVENPFYDLKQMKCTANDPRLVEALEWRCKWVRRYGAEELGSFRSAFGWGDADPLGLGMVSMTFSGTWMHDMYKTYFPDLDWGVGRTPVPAKYGGQSDGTCTGSEGYAVPRGALAKGHLEAAWKCLRYMSGPEGQMIFAKAGDNIVTRRDLVDDPYMTRTPQYAFFMSQLPCGWIRPPIPEGAMMWAELAAAEDKAALGEGTPKELLDEVTTRIDQAMEQWK
ncbi:MAG: ABC transporter substrate-binding protein [Anaerolineae bacterium]|nr:ABC transporter substrate-binding protein [Anaerolineae bacterium]